MYLINSETEKVYGPFHSIERAWGYMFGRESTEVERELFREAGWCVVEARSESASRRVECRKVVG
ncbi:TPA: hypothetical protein ACK3RK_006091 [Burkholderia cepacia]